MNWLEIVNYTACFFLLYGLLAVGHLANRWSHRIALAPLSLMIGVEVIDPIVSWIPEAAWPTVAFKCAICFAILIMRKDLWAAAQVRMA